MREAHEYLPDYSNTCLHYLPTPVDESVDVQAGLRGKMYDFLTFLTLLVETQPISLYWFAGSSKLVHLDDKNLTCFIQNLVHKVVKKWLKLKLKQDKKPTYMWHSPSKG